MSKATQNGSLIVDAGKLSKGLRITFEGIAMVFDSIGANEEMKSAAMTIGKKEVPATDGTDVSGDNTDGEPETTTPKEPKKPEPIEAGSASDPAETTLAIDDITRIIVQKLKQDRSNNEKIGQLLKAYGVSRVSELDSSAYEAFLTDLVEL